MNDKTFVDTNILLYAYDLDAGRKHEIAKGILKELWYHHLGVLSTQVLQEFYVNVTKKISAPLAKPVARAIVQDYSEWSVDTTSGDLSTAFLVEDQSRISFWDALIVAAARKAGAARILTEDLNSGQTILGVKIENPFLAPVS